MRQRSDSAEQEGVVPSIQEPTSPDDEGRRMITEAELMAHRLVAFISVPKRYTVLYKPLFSLIVIGTITTERF